MFPKAPQSSLGILRVPQLSYKEVAFYWPRLPCSASPKARVPAEFGPGGKPDHLEKTKSRVSKMVSDSMNYVSLNKFQYI